MKAFALFCSVFLISSLALSKDVTPKEKLGSFKLILPDTSGLETKYQDLLGANRFQFEFRSAGNRKNIEPNETYEVKAGVGCLKIYSRNYRMGHERCDILIQQKQLTQYTLATLIPTWNPELFAVEFGVQPNFQVSPANENVFWKLSPYLNKNVMTPKPIEQSTVATFAFSRPL